MRSLGIFLLLMFLDYAASKAKSGPYVSRLYDMRNCEKPPKPYSKNPPFIVNVKIHNSSDGHAYLRGNFSIQKNRRFVDFKMRARFYRKEGSRWKIIRIMNSAGCRGLLAASVSFVLGYKYDQKYCTGPTGIFQVDKFDVNKLEHMWSPEREYGNFLWIIDVQVKTATLMCMELKTLVTPLKK